jgi:hypothetical protein
MSRAYRIEVGESLSRTLSSDDEVSTQIELLPVLPEESMRRILAQELEKRGFHEEEGKHVRKNSGVVVTVDAKSGEVTVRAEDSERIDLSAKETGIYADDWGASQRQVEQQLSQKLREGLEEQAAAREKKLRKETTDRLERELCDVLRELDQVSNRTIGEALKIKAREMGDVKEIVEDERTGSLKIVLDV